MVKNRLATIAADNADMAVMKDHLKGPTAIMFGPESQVDPAKIVVDFAKDNEAMEIKGGFVDGQYLDAEPGRGPVQGPEQGRVDRQDDGQHQLAGHRHRHGRSTVSIGALARAIDAVAKQKAEAA